MNNSIDPSGGLLGPSNLGGFRYGIGVSVGALFLITTITLATYFCTRRSQTTSLQQQPPGQNNAGPDHHDHHQLNQQHCVIEVGLDEETLKGYPKLLYSGAKIDKKDSTAVCCSICLVDYKSSDDLRMLPDCGHLFHVKCVDPWLRLHPTCPVCRTSPLPSPLSTPLAEVTPLAARPVS